MKKSVTIMLACMLLGMTPGVLLAQFQYFELSYSLNNNNLLLNTEKTEFYENDELQSSEMTSDGRLEEINKNVDINMQTQELGLSFWSHIQNTNLQYGLEFGISEQTYHYLEAGETVLKYNSISPNYFMALKFRFHREFSSRHSIHTEFGLKYSWGSLNNVEDAEYGFDHPDFTEEYDNTNQYPEINVDLKYQFYRKGLSIFVGPAIRYSIVEQEIQRKVIDIALEETFTEHYERDFGYSIPVGLILGLEKELKGHLTLNVSSYISQTWSLQTLLSIHF